MVTLDTVSLAADKCLAHCGAAGTQLRKVNPRCPDDNWDIMRQTTQSGYWYLRKAVYGIWTYWGVLVAQVYRRRGKCDLESRRYGHSPPNSANPPGYGAGVTATLDCSISLRYAMRRGS